MTPTRLRACLVKMDRTERWLARTLLRPEAEVRAWSDGGAPVPEDVAAWLERCAAFAEEWPAPSS